jgi:hypothetical protein
VDRFHKKPKIIFILVKITRVLFGPNKYIKIISISLFYDKYNYNINIVDRGN